MAWHNSTLRFTALHCTTHGVELLVHVDAEGQRGDGVRAARLAGHRRADDARGVAVPARVGGVGGGVGEIR